LRSHSDHDLELSSKLLFQTLCPHTVDHEKKSVSGLQKVNRRDNTKNDI
jgi:hypothetical protein